MSSIQRDVIVPTEAVGAFFDRLRAPLGDWELSSSARNAQGELFFLAWADRKKSVNGTTWRLLGRPHQAVAAQWNKDVIQVRAGARAYLVVATAEDTDAEARVVKLVNEGMVVPVGRLGFEGADVWAECLPPVPVAKVIIR